MIREITLKNFQSHRDSTLKFHDGLNVIVGTSDSGKTAIIRGLRLLKDNRPSGDAFRSYWGGDTEVEIITDEEYCIRRTKGDENTYYVGADGTDVTLKAFKSDVPEEVSRLLNMDDTNLQKQFDSPFLISKSPGEVAAYFNHIAHLDQIDKGLGVVNRTILSINSKKKVDEKRLVQLQDARPQFDYLQKFEVDLESLEQLHTDQQQNIQQKNGISTVLEQVQTVEDKISDAAWVLEHEKAVNDIIKLHEDKEDTFQGLDELQGILSEITSIESEIEYDRKQTELLPSVHALLKLMEDKKQKGIDYKALQDLLENIRDAENGLLDFGLELRDHEKQFHKFMPETCPLCGTNLKKDEKG